MSFISTGVEYGLHCLLFLAHPRDGLEGSSVRDLAELQGVSTTYLAKLFTKLAKADIVVATEGIRGGFRLARAPEAISVHDIVVAIDGRNPLFDCREIRGRCAIFQKGAPAWATRGVCSINAVMQMSEKAMRDELMRHTLADLAQRTLEKAPSAYVVQVDRWLAGRFNGRRVEGDAEASASETSGR